MADAIQSEYVAREHPALANVLNCPNHTCHDVIRFEFFQIPSSTDTSFVVSQTKRTFATSPPTSDDPDKFHSHRTKESARTCSSSLCKTLDKLGCDPRIAVNQFPLRLAPVFLCHLMWRKNKSTGRYECDVPLRCFFFVPTKESIGTNSCAEVKQALYENNLAQLDRQKFPLATYPIPLTLLAQSATCVFNMARFSPMDLAKPPGFYTSSDEVVGNGTPQAPKLTEPATWAAVACRQGQTTMTTLPLDSTCFYGEPGNEGSPSITLVSVSNNQLYHNLSPILKQHGMHVVKDRVYNGFLWHLIRDTYYQCSGRPGVLSCYACPDHFFSEKLVNKRDHLKMVCATTHPYISQQLRLLKSFNKFCSEAYWAMLSMTERTMLVMPRYRYITSPMHFPCLDEGSNLPNTRKERRVPRHDIDKVVQQQEAALIFETPVDRFVFVHKQLTEDESMGVEFECTRITSVDRQTYWAISSLTASLDAETWQAFYPGTPLPTEARSSRCDCVDDTCFPYNITSFKTGVNLVTEADAGKLV